MPTQKPFYAFSKFRLLLVLLVLLIAIVAVWVRIFYLDTADKKFLVGQGKHESIHYVNIPPMRGNIFDRNGVPLAVSTFLDNVIFDPKVLNQYPQYWPRIAEDPLFNLSMSQVKALITQRPNSRYQIALKGVPPQKAKQIMALDIPGIYLETHPTTFYPLGAATAQLVGFTNINNKGQDGIELSQDQVLRGTMGRAETLKTAIGQAIGIVAYLIHPHPGHNVTLSIDSRIQYVAYKALAEKVIETHAKSGSAVVLNPKTGEVLVAVSYPDFNPNDLSDRTGPGVRDRAITDTFEPASTIKVLTLAVALASGKYTPTKPVDTNPGYYFIHGNRVRDDANFGEIDVTKVLTKSSNVGVSKIALSLPHHEIYNMFLKAGIGSSPGGDFPAEASGVIHPYNRIGLFEFATMTFGYAISMSTLQLAKMYGAIADGGVIRPVSFIKKAQPNPGKRIMSKPVAKQLIQMLETVVGRHGTGILANIPGYRVAGKTGTSHLVGPHGFYRNRFNAIFIGLVPADNPRVVIVVRINDPRGHFNGFGGVSAAPVFAKIALACMHILGIPPTKDQINQELFRDQKRWIRAISHA